LCLPHYLFRISKRSAVDSISSEDRFDILSNWNTPPLYSLGCIVTGLISVDATVLLKMYNVIGDNEFYQYFIFFVILVFSQFYPLNCGNSKHWNIKELKWNIIIKNKKVVCLFHNYCCISYNNIRCFFTVMRNLVSGSLKLIFSRL